MSRHGLVDGWGGSDQGGYFLLSKFSWSPDTVCDGDGGSGSEGSVDFWS